MSGKPVSVGDIAAWIADSIDGVYDDEAEVHGGATVALIDGPTAIVDVTGKAVDRDDSQRFKVTVEAIS